MSCIIRGFVKVVALPLKLTAKVLKKLSSVVVKAGVKAGKSCGKCGAKACKQCHRNSARTCRIFRKHSQKACKKLGANTKSFCARCGGKCPKCCGPLGRCSHRVCKKCGQLCAKCPAKHFKSSAAFRKRDCSRHARLTARERANQDNKKRKSGHSYRLQDRRSNRKLKGSNQDKGDWGRATKPLDHDDPSSHRTTYERSKHDQPRTREKSNVPPKASKRRRPSRSAPRHVFGEKGGEIDHSGVKGEKVKDVPSHSKGESHTRKEKEGSETSVAAHTAISPVNKIAQAALQGKDGDGIETQRHTILKSRNIKLKDGSQPSPAACAEVVPATLEDAHIREGNGADALPLPTTRAQAKNPGTNRPSNGHKARELTHSSEEGAQECELSRARGVKQKGHRKSKQREQSRRSHKERNGTNVEDDSSAEAALPHRQATLLQINMTEKTGLSKQHQEKVHSAASEKCSLQEKHRKAPTNVNKAVEVVEWSANNGNSKRHTAKAGKEKVSDGGKSPSKIDGFRRMDLPVAEAIEEKRRNKTRKRSLSAENSVTNTHTAEAPAQDVPENSTKHVQRGNAIPTQLHKTNTKLKDDPLPLPCVDQMKLPKGSKATDPWSRNDKKRIENQRLQGEAVAKVRPAEQYIASGSQNSDSQFYDEKELEEQTTLFGIECRVLPE